MSKRLYSWQAEAKQYYLKSTKRVFSCVACPGAGKTHFALSLVQYLQASATIDAAIITVHSKALKFQWLTVASTIGLNFSSNLRGLEKGTVLTHQQYTQNENLIEQILAICKQKKILLISDEHHHLSDNRIWGEAMAKAFVSSKKVLLLSGTLFRHDDGIIPFVTYDENGVSQPDYEYSYKRALSDRVVAPIFFPVYGGKAQWRYGTEGSIASFGDELSLIGKNRQLVTAVTSFDWLNAVLSEAVERLLLLRKSHPAAAGLLIAKDTEHARYLAGLLENITGNPPVLAISDEPQAHQQIEDFGKEESGDCWLVAIKMVSEGIDIPRLRVGIFATNITTELFFRQLVGRLIRISKNCSWASPNYLYLPGHTLLIDYARNYAQERSHILNLENWLERGRIDLLKERELFEPLSAKASVLETISAVPAVGETALEQLERSLLKLDFILDETTALKEELINLRYSLVSPKDTSQVDFKETNFADREARHVVPLPTINFC